MSSTKPHNIDTGQRRAFIEGIKSRVRARVGSQLRDLEVAVQSGGLVLQGRTRTHYAKQLALQAVMDHSELPILSNEIQVRRDDGEANCPSTMRAARHERAALSQSSARAEAGSISLSVGPVGPASYIDTVASV